MELKARPGQSVADYLIRITPDMELRFIPSKKMINPLATRSLFALWKDKSNKLSDRTYHRPPTMSQHEISAITQAGLAKEIDNKIEITDKGSSVLGIMLLGDESSIFDKAPPVSIKLTMDPMSRTEISSSSYSIIPTTYFSISLFAPCIGRS